MKTLKTIPLFEPTEPPETSSSPIQSEYSLQRRKSFHVMEIARKEGIISAKPTRKMASVEGRLFYFIYLA